MISNKSPNHWIVFHYAYLKIIICLLSLLVAVSACGLDDPDHDSATPSEYDLRDQHLITPVRDQNGKKSDGTSDMGSTVGLCWAFSSLASLESNMLKQGINTDPFSTEASLSPWYLGNYIGFNNPVYEFNADTIPGLEPLTSFGYYAPGHGWGGGGCFWTADYLVAGKRLPTWDDCPMPVADQTARLTLTKPTLKRTKQYNIAQMSLIFADDFTSVADYRNHLKRYIMENGAIQSMVHLEAIDLQGMVSQIVKGIEYKSFRFMDKDNFNMYTYEANNWGTDFLTHAVTIAGWDDTRLIDVAGHKTTGAWLIKDSQGETSWDDGYFWAAYEDPAVNVMACGLVACKEENYEHQSKYQTYPGMLSKLKNDTQFNESTLLDLGEYGYLMNGYTAGTSWGFAEFSLSSPETLAAVGIFNSNRNQKATVQVYKDGLQGAPLLFQDVTLKEIGYHLIKLDNEIHFFSSETMIIGVGFEESPEHKRLPLTYVQDDDHDFVYPTYFGKFTGDEFQLTAYSEMDPKSAFFLQAIVRNSFF